MRFQTIESVPIEDTERVLAVLEQRLRAMMKHVEREGNRITLSGLGPSSRVVNRHDTTVIEAWPDEGVTVIAADVSFQASAFLGATGQKQEDIMRLKLSRLFEETKEQLDLESRHDQARIARMEALVGGSAVPGRLASRRKSEGSPAEDSSAMAQRLLDTIVVDDTAQVKETTELPGSSQPTEDSTAEIEPVAFPTTEVAAKSAATPAPTSTVFVNEPGDSVEGDGEPQDGGEERSNRWMLWAVLAACIPAVLPFGAHYISTLRTDKAAPTYAVSAPSAMPAKPVPAAEPTDLLRQWELAMNSRDAAAQAAFYAVPVERYFLRRNVNKEQVEADKQQQIDNRKGLWTVKMEKVKIDRKADNIATVSLLKRYRQQEDGKPVKEWFVPSQLKLKREYGVWWITSERDFSLKTSQAEPGAISLKLLP